jgi:tetratricopeptide (TPR) repeat protein
MNIFIFLLALLLRLGVIVQLQDEPLYRTPQLDSLEYVEWGSQLASGDFTWPVAPIHGPGYPFFIGAVLAITRSLLGVAIVQAFLGSVAAALTYSIGRRLFGSTAGVAAGVLHATYAPLMLVDVSILGEALLVSLLTATLWIIVAQPRHAPVIAGLILGLAIVVRPTAAVMLPLFAFFFGRRWWVFVATAIVPVVPVIILGGTIQTSGGMNFYIGNSPLRDGTAWARPGGEWDAMRGMAWRAGVTGATAEDRFYIRQTLNEIGADPAAYLRTLASKAMWFISDEEVRDSHSFHFFAARSSLLRWLPRFGIVFALAVCGIVSRRSPLLLGYTLILALTVVLLVAGFRYRMPIMPALFLFAGAGLATAIADRSRRPLLAALFVAAIIIANLREHPSSHEFSEELTMTALAVKNEGQLDAAVGIAQRATLVNPRRDAAWVALGDIEALRGRWVEAERLWRHAIEIAPNNVRAWSHLAHAHYRRGEFAEAEASLKRALSIRPDGEAQENLHILKKSTPGAKLGPDPNLDIVVELAEDVAGELQAVVAGAADVGDGSDFFAGDRVGLGEGFEGEGAAGEERFGARQAKDNGTDAAVGDADRFDRVAAATHQHRRGEG